jgi:hypothetical protein
MEDMVGGSVLKYTILVGVTLSSQPFLLNFATAFQKVARKMMNDFAV